MQPQRGDTISFSYLPSQLPDKKPLWGHAIVERVIRERNVAVVRVWSGKNCSPLSPQEYYEEIEVPLDKAHLDKRKDKQRKR